MPKYIQTKDVKDRLIGKVKFTTEACDENAMQETLLAQLIENAESEVEYDLSPRYAAPLQTDDGGAFKLLPSNPTRNMLREIIILKSVCYVLDTDFGRGTVVNAEEYSSKQEKRYTKLTDKLIEHRAKEHSQWKYPPLPGLKLNYQNDQSDDGFAGQVLVSNPDSSSGSYAAEQINDPAHSYWNPGECP